MLIHASGIYSGDDIITPSYQSGNIVKSTILTEDGSVMVKYFDDSVEWFESSQIVVRRDRK